VLLEKPDSRAAGPLDGRTEVLQLKMFLFPPSLSCLAAQPPSRIPLWGISSLLKNPLSGSFGRFSPMPLRCSTHSP